MRVSHLNICEEGSLNRGNSKSKGSEGGVWLVCWKSSEEVSLAGEEK